AASQPGVDCLCLPPFHGGFEAAEPEKPGIPALALAYSDRPVADSNGREARLIHGCLFAGRPSSWQCAAVAQLAGEVYTSPLNTNGCHVEFARTNPRTERAIARCFAK